MQRQRVMIVEDEGLIAEDIACQLSESGYEVAAISSSGEEALSRIESSAPDLVLMDIRLKGKLDGIDAAARVRSEHRLPVIFLTSHADSETLARAKKAEPFGYLVKPFRQLSLCSAIEIALYKHRSERLLTEREAWLATVLQSTADPTIVTDVAGRIQFLNAGAERLLGRILADVAGMNWMDAAPIFDPRSDSPSIDPVPLVISSLTARTVPRGAILRRADGSEVAVEGEVSPSILREHIAGAVITIRDVSQRNREEAEARQEQKMAAVGRMAGGVAHDFNNLLTVILGHGAILAEGMSNPEDIESVRAVLDAAETARGISQQLLALSGKRVLRDESLHVNERIRSMASVLTASLPPGIHFQMNLDDQAGKVRMAAANLDQVLLNLIWNARDAIETEGTISVATSNLDRMVEKRGVEVTESFVRITVTDSGEGFRPEVQERIFEPFFTTKPHGGGTGLGLAIVYGIVKEAGGDIAAISTPGAGTCFEVFLPRTKEEPARPVEAKAAPSTDSSGPITVLLVEDQAAIRGLIHRCLKKRGFDLIEAGDGQEALELSAKYEGRIDVLVTDVLMPRLDGVSLSRQLALTRPNLKVLFISGQPGDFVETFRDPRFRSAYLPKPFAMSSLLDKVRELTADP